MSTDGDETMAKDVDHEATLARAFDELKIAAAGLPPSQSELGRLVLLVASVIGSRIEILEAKLAALVEAGRHANRLREVACVNACKGIPTKVLEAGRVTVLKTTKVEKP